MLFLRQTSMRPAGAALPILKAWRAHSVFLILCCLIGGGIFAANLHVPGWGRTANHKSLRAHSVSLIFNRLRRWGFRSKFRRNRKGHLLPDLQKLGGFFVARFLGKIEKDRMVRHPGIHRLPARKRGCCPYEIQQYLPRHNSKSCKGHQGYEWTHRHFL